MFAVSISIVLIAVATLTPGATNGGSAAHWQFTVGATPLTDACSNVLLFVPLGAALASLGWRVRVAASVGVLLSVVIEVLQSAGHPVGRYATYADLIANSVGAIGGALVVNARLRWLHPNARNAQRLAYGWSAMVVLLVMVTSWLLSPIHPYGADASLPTLSRLENAPGYPWFSGTVLHATLSGVELVHHGTGPVRVTAPTAAREAVVNVISRDDRLSFVPVLYVHDARDTVPYLLLGQLGDDAVLRSPRHGDALGLRMPQLVVRGAFASGPMASGPVASGGVAATDRAQRELVVAVTPARLTMRLAGADSLPRVRPERLDLTASLGWLMTQPVVGDDATSRTWGTAAWLLLLVAPAWFWVGRSGDRRARTSIVVLGGIAGVFLLTPPIFGVAWLPIWQWNVLVFGATAGALGSRWPHPANS